jgi:F420-dependent oxidoreductase-like protein
MEPVKIGLQIPDFTWPGSAPTLRTDLAGIARTADDAGFEFIAVMDHFFQIRVVGPPENDMLEAYTTLGFLAANTSRAKLLTLVTGVVYRHPGILAKQVTTLDVLSGGRAWLGIGAAWNDEESAGLGIPFPPLKERFERLEETLQIVHRMFDGNEEPFAGKHFQLARPLNSPAPLTRPHPPIMIGGSGEKKTLKLVARYADACNLFPTPDLPHKLDVLRQHCENEGRDYDSILKTVILRMNVGPDGQGVDDLLARLQSFADLGFQAVIGQVMDVSTIKPLEIIGRDVIPVAESF